MQRALTLYSTSIGKKVAMALSGAILVGFVIGHMPGTCNLYSVPKPSTATPTKLQASLPLYVDRAHRAPRLAFGMHIA